MEDNPRRLIEIADEIRKLSNEAKKLAVTANVKVACHDISCGAYKIWNQCHYVER